MAERHDRRDSGEPGGGEGRREKVERTGVWPASGPLPPGPAPTIGQAEFGQGARGAAGAAEGGSSELVIYETDPVCGVNVAPEHAEQADHRGHTYYFDSAECKRRFEESPGRYAVQPERRTG